MAIAFTFLAVSSKAATFTAVQNGDWSLGSTWSGGVAPAFNIFADNIIIPTGINVNLDGNLEVNGLLAELNVVGNLETSSSSTIAISQGFLTGNGMIDVDRIVFGATANSTFTGGFVANTLVSNSFNLFVNGTVSINDSLVLNGGDLDLSATTDSLWLAANTVVWLNNGTITGSGELVAQGSYDVFYRGTSYASGLELTSTFLNNISVDLDDSNNEIALSGNTATTGTIELTRGRLDMNGYNLAIEGDYNQSTNAALMGDEDSELWIMSASSLSSSITFDDNSNEIGRIVIDFQTSGEASFNSDSRIISELRLVNGDLAIESGSEFSVATEGMVWINEGSIDLNGSATFENEGDIRLMYTGAEKSTGAELMTGVVTDFSLDLDDDNQSLWLMTDLTITDTASIMDGRIKMNGNDLGFTGYAMSMNRFKLDGDEESMLWIGGMFATESMFEFEGGDSLSALVMNLDNQSNVWLEGSLYVADSLSLQSGVLTVNNSNLWIMADAMINGGSESSFVQTEGYARLGLMVEGDNQANVEFPLGDNDGFSPIRISNAETNDANFTVNLNSVVLLDGTSGYDVSNSEPVVNKTWDIEADVNADIDVTLETEWNTAMEVNGFDRSRAYISHYMNGSWDTDVAAAAQATTSGSFILTRGGITSLSPFSVQNEESVTAINEIGTASFNVYPNPVQQTLFVDLNEMDIDQVLVFDLNGKQLMVQPASNTNGQLELSVVDLNPGFYFLRFEKDGSTITTERIVKF